MPDTKPKHFYCYPSDSFLILQEGEIPVEITRSRTVEIRGSYEKVGLRVTFPVQRPASMKEFAKTIADLTNWMDMRLDITEKLLRNKLGERSLTMEELLALDESTAPSWLPWHMQRELEEK